MRPIENHSKIALGLRKRRGQPARQTKPKVSAAMPDRKAAAQLQIFSRLPFRRVADRHYR